MSVVMDNASDSFIALPQFAPLPVSFVLHLLNLSTETFLYQFQYSYDQLEPLLDELEKKVITAREFVIEKMAPVIERKARATQWFPEVLQEQINEKSRSNKQQSDKQQKIYSISRPTRGNWQKSNVLLPAVPEYRFLDRAGAIIISSMVDPRKQGYTPEYVPPSEAHYWVYAQISPTSPVFPCPIPLPSDLPAGTLLWSRWRTLDPSWQQYNWGAMRFSSIDQAALARWDPTISNRDLSLLYDDRGIFGGMTQTAVKRRADGLLDRYAPGLLSPRFTPPDVSLLFSPERVQELAQKLGLKG